MLGLSDRLSDERGRGGETPPIFHTNRLSDNVATVGNATHFPHQSQSSQQMDAAPKVESLAFGFFFVFFFLDFFSFGERL